MLYYVYWTWTVCKGVQSRTVELGPILFHPGMLVRPLRQFGERLSDIGHVDGVAYYKSVFRR